jgi:hypothetical protein
MHGQGNFKITLQSPRQSAEHIRFQPHREQFVYIIMFKSLMLFRVLITVYCEYYMGHINTVCGLEEDSLGLKKAIRIVTTPLRKNLGGLDVHGSVHHSINPTEITNRTQPCTRIYYSNV